MLMGNDLHARDAGGQAGQRAGIPGTPHAPAPLVLVDARRRHRARARPRRRNGATVRSPLPSWSPSRSPRGCETKTAPSGAAKSLILLRFLVGGTGFEPVTPAV